MRQRRSVSQTRQICCTVYEPFPIGERYTYLAGTCTDVSQNSVTAKICSHRRVRIEISTRTRWFFLCWKFVIFHAKFMCGVSPYPTQPLFALPLHHWVPLQTLPTVGRLLPLQSVPKTILNFPKPCFQIVL